MRRVAAFCEDAAQEKVIDALVRRLADKSVDNLELDWRVARGGRAIVVAGLKRYAMDIRKHRARTPDLTIVATDANCKGYSEAVRSIPVNDIPAPVALAIPDPHVERWLLLDSQAFKTVFGRGCKAPDQKCNKGRYKERLISAIRGANKDVRPILGGMEFATHVINAMNIERTAVADASFGRFVDAVRSAVATWQGGER